MHRLMWICVYRPLPTSLNDNVELQDCLEVGRTAMVNRFIVPSYRKVDILINKYFIYTLKFSQIYILISSFSLQQS